MTHMPWILSLGALLVAGCVAPVTYNHPGKALAEKHKDHVECLATANQAAADAGGWSSDPAIRSAIFANARDRYFAMCLESRGWVRGRASGPRPSKWVSADPEKDLERGCQQGALHVLGYYDLWQDGRDSWWWQQALQRYQSTKGLDAQAPEAPAQLRTAIDEDLQARGAAAQWRRCLQEAGGQGTKPSRGEASPEERP